MSSEKDVAIDFSSYRKLIFKLSKIVTFDTRVLSEAKSRKEKWEIYFKNAFFVFCVFNGILGHLLTCINLYNIGSIRAVTGSLTTFIAVLPLIARSYAFFTNKSQLAEILRELNSVYTHSDDINNYAKFYKRYVFYILLMSIFSPILLYHTPITEAILTGELAFPFASPFYQRTVSIYAYPFALLWSIWSFCLLSMITVTSDFILYGFITVISIEFEILRRNFENLKGQVSVEEQLRALIDRHIQLSDHVTKLENIFSFSLFASFITSSFVICFCAFQASILTDVTETFEMAFYCMISLQLILIQCYFGHLLKTASERLMSGIYDSGWEELRDFTVTKGFVLIMKRAQKPTVITMMKFADITLYQVSTVRKKKKDDLREGRGFVCTSCDNH
jgi:hypothetical protein